MGVGGWLFHDLIYFWKSKYVSDGFPLCPFRNWTGWVRGWSQVPLSLSLAQPSFPSSRAASSVPQVTLLSFSVDSEFTFVDYIRGG